VQAETVSPDRTYFVWLDPLRAFAACTVLIYHLIALGGLSISNAFPLSWFHFGWLGVDLFYAISGAVIVLSLDHLRATMGDAWRRSFALRRVARVVPLYLVTGTVFVLLIRPDLLQQDDAWRIVLAHLLFVHNWFPSTHGVINGPSWTLGVEMQFYALALLAGPWFLRAPVWRIAVLLSVLALCWRGAVWAWFIHGPGDPVGRGHFIYATQLPGVIDVFGAGIVAARLWLARRHACRVLPCALLALLGWLGVLALLHLSAAVFWSHPLSAIGFRSAVAVASALTVATALAASATRPFPWLRWSGDVSYGLYLWHMPVLLWLLPRWEWGSWPLAASVLAATILLSAAAYKAVERPFQQSARRQRRTPG
jgi:peptidoglycan/LPS O-acetylase OafA/YrhL